MIKPSIGRVVWFHPPQEKEGDQPHSAQIAFVHSDTMVNLGVLNANGSPYSATSITLYQGEGDKPSLPYCEWMPFQLGQSAAVKAAQAEVKPS